jgi:hypothetical protein
MTGDSQRPSPRILLAVGGVVLFVITVIALIALTAGIPAKVGPAAADGPVFAPRAPMATPITVGPNSLTANDSPAITARKITQPTPAARTSTAKPPAAKPSSAPTTTTAKPALSGFRLTNVVTGKCVGLQDGAVAQVNCADAARIKAVPTRVVSGMRSTTQLHWLRFTYGAKKCLDLPGEGARPSGTVVLAYECVEPTEADNQEWRLQDLGTTTRGHEEYALVHQASGQCLDVTGTTARGTDLAVGLALTVFRCQTQDGGWDDHRWIFE